MKVNIRSQSKIAIYGILVMLLLSSLLVAPVICVEASENTPQLKIQRDVTYNIQVDGSVRCTRMMVLYNPVNETCILDKDCVFSEPVTIKFPSGVYEMNMTVRDLNVEKYHNRGMEEYKKWLETNPNGQLSDFVKPHEYIVLELELNETFNQLSFVVYVNCGELEILPYNNYFCLMSYEICPLDNVSGESDYKRQHALIPEGSEGVLVPEGYNFTRNRVTLNLPQDAYHWSEVLFIYPDYDVAYSQGRSMSYVWNSWPKSQERAIIIEYSLHEDEVQQKLSEATINSERLGWIALGLGILSVFLGSLSIYYSYSKDRK